MASNGDGESSLQSTLSMVRLETLYQFRNTHMDDETRALVAEFKRNFDEDTKWSLVRGWAIHFVPEIFNKILGGESNKSVYFPRFDLLFLQGNFMPVNPGLEPFFMFLKKFVPETWITGAPLMADRMLKEQVEDRIFNKKLVNWHDLLYTATLSSLRDNKWEKLLLLGIIIRTSIGSPRVLDVPFMAGILTGQSRAYYNTYEHKMKRAYEIVASLDQDIRTSSSLMIKKPKLEVQQPKENKHLLDLKQKLVSLSESFEADLQSSKAGTSESHAERAHLQNLPVNEFFKVKSEKLQLEVNTLKNRLKDREEHAEGVENEEAQQYEKFQAICKRAGELRTEVEKLKAREKLFRNEKLQLEAQLEARFKISGSLQIQVADLKAREELMEREVKSCKAEITKLKASADRADGLWLEAEKLKAIADGAKQELQLKVELLQVAEQAIFKMTCKLESQDGRVTELSKQLEDANSKNAKLEAQLLKFSEAVKKLGSID